MLGQLRVPTGADRSGRFQTEGRYCGTGSATRVTLCVNPGCPCMVEGTRPDLTLPEAAPDGDHCNKATSVWRRPISAPRQWMLRDRRPGDVYQAICGVHTWFGESSLRMHLFGPAAQDAAEADALTKTFFRRFTDYYLTEPRRHVSETIIITLILRRR